MQFFCHVAAISDNLPHARLHFFWKAGVVERSAFSGYFYQSQPYQTMKKRIAAIVATGFCSLSPIASAATPYISTAAGTGVISSYTEMIPFTTPIQTSYDTGVTIDGGIGLKISDFRLEANLNYQTNKVDKTTSDTVRAKLFSYLANVYYDIPSPSIRPYLMLGAGGTSITLKKSSQDDRNENALSLQVGTGVGIKATGNITVDLGYRYFTAFNLLSDDVTCHRFLLGARYSF